MDKIDAYLLHTDTGHNLLPMLVRVADASDIPSVSAAPDCKIGSSIGNIFSCQGSRRTIEAFAADHRVVSVEASR